jgi:hypothetical protein
MKRTAVILASLLAVAVGASAKTPPAAAPAPAEAPAPAAPEAPKVEPYVLKNLSSFTLPADTRPPFWPIGWQKRGPTQPIARVAVPVAPGKNVQLSADHFTLSAILTAQPGQPALATINGRSFQQGDVLSVVLAGQKLKITLRAIQDGGVYLDRDGTPFFVPLRRPGEVILRPPANPDVLKTQDPNLIELDPVPKKK